MIIRFDESGNQATYDLLAEVLVLSNVGVGASLVCDRVGSNAELALEESLGSLRRVGGLDTTLGQRVIDTLGAEGLERRGRVVRLELSLLRSNRAHTVGGVARNRVPRRSDDAGGDHQSDSSELSERSHCR